MRNKLQTQQRLQELLNAFRNGQEFALHGNLSCMGALELPDKFHKIKGYDGFIYEIGALGFFDKKTYLQKVLQHAQTKKKPVLVLDNKLIYEITPDMDLKKVIQKQTETKEKLDAFSAEQRQRQEDIRNEADKENQTLTIINQNLWNGLIEENRLAPVLDFVPKNFSTDSESRIKRLKLYARILEGQREKDGQITPSAIAYADDIAELSLDMRKMCRNDPTLPNVRFEGLRFWADVILARTWKYGDELLTAEGFTKEEITLIKASPALPTRYTYWEGLSHPFMRDLRVTSFLRGEKVKPIAHKKNVCEITAQRQKD